MSPLQHPNVEIMIATAMIAAPALPNITSIAAVPTRSSHFSSSERDIVPRIGGKQRADLRHTYCDQHSQCAARCRDRCDKRKIGPNWCRGARRPKIREVCAECVSVAPNENPKRDQRDQRQGFRGSENVLDEFA